MGVFPVSSNMMSNKFLGQKNLFFYYYFSFKEVMTKLFFPTCFGCFFYMYIQMAVTKVQMGTCTVKGADYGVFTCKLYISLKTSSLWKRELSFYGILSSKAVKTFWLEGGGLTDLLSVKFVKFCSVYADSEDKTNMWKIYSRWKEGLCETRRVCDCETWMLPAATNSKYGKNL